MTIRTVLNQPQPLQAGMAVLADDDMVEAAVSRDANFS
jgi:hypothetical protein